MNKLTLLIPALVLASCGGGSQAFYKEQDKLYQVSMTQYQDYNCNQIKAEMLRVSHLVNQQTALVQGQPEEDKNEYLDTAVKVFAITRGMQMNQEDDKSEERIVLARLKSQYNALDQLFIQKDCVAPDGK